MSEKVRKKTSRKKAASSEETSLNPDDYFVFPETVAVLPSRDLVAFPSVMMSIYIERPQSIRAVEVAREGDGLVLILAQRSLDTEDPTSKDLFRVGVLASVVKMLKLPDGRCKILLQGIARAKITEFSEGDELLAARIEELRAPENYELGDKEIEAVARIRANLQLLVEHEHLPEEMLLVTEEITDPAILADVIIAHYKLDVNYAQSMLEELDPVQRIHFTDKIIADDVSGFFVSENIRDKTQNEMAKGQREYFLREQLKQIQRELGEGDSGSEDLSALKKSLVKAKMPQPVSQEAMKQFGRLERMHTESGEYSILRTYLEWFADLPWSVRTKDKLNIKQAKKILNDDHFGIDKAKDRILEYLSVRKLKNDSKGPILCFVGPPGVGKTSLGRSIANCMGRKFFRMSLGGVRDEAEIRGHRRTYVGSLPGKIVQGIKEAGSNNPVFLLDELDKIGADFRGDPAAALLEVLDPEQNKDFRDHYLNVPFDLSSCLFIATANTLDTIPEALIDRLEIIFISGYTTAEKLHIAQHFLIPRQLKEKGLTRLKVKFDDAAIMFLIERFTQEAGVRSLEREIASLFRKMAREYVETKSTARKITVEVVKKLLGVTKYDPEENERRQLVGLARGLAWTTHGGEVMPVEASIAQGKGKLTLTGQLGNVMQESAQAAMFYARANAAALNLPADFYNTSDIHIHVPGGATPKDGPSAGVTIVTALVSALSNRRISKDVAMTGEITLRGSVMPVGGIKEKALAALRYGIKTVILPYGNIKDLEEIPKDQRAKLKFVPVKHINEVLELALLDAPSRVKGKVSRKGLRQPIIV